MAEYDLKVIRQYADSLYAKANSIIRNYTLSYAVIGGAVAFAASSFALELSDTGNLLVGLVGALVFASAGRAAGQSKAFSLKLQAQQALCQAKIEENTRAGLSAEAVRAGAEPDS